MHPRLCYRPSRDEDRLRKAKLHDQDNGSEAPDLPLEPGALARWFAEGVRAELAALDKEGGAQTYELLAGQLVEATGATGGIVQFLVADGSRIPEDATGTLKAGREEYDASVVAQEANRIVLQLDGRAAVPVGIPRAIFTVDDTALLRKLAEILEELAATPETIGPLAASVFHPSHGSIGFARLPDTAAFARITGEHQVALEQALGSSLTYIWGPPGTGKTHAIAHLVAALVENGKRVLVASHTHAAVDAALYAAVNPEPERTGPLAEHTTVTLGQILRIGRTADQKIPDGVRFDKVLEAQARHLQLAVSELEARAKTLSTARSQCRVGLASWERLDELTGRLEAARAKVHERELTRVESHERILRASDLIERRQAALERAREAWLFPGRKTKAASGALGEAHQELRAAQFHDDIALNQRNLAQGVVAELAPLVEAARARCDALPGQATLQAEESALVAELEPIEAEIAAKQDEIARLQRELIDRARAIFCTLTKCYLGKELDGQRFDAVVIDELSMALPPLVFLGASRATSQVVLVGDYLQLPPIVRSDSEISSARLKEDVFHLAGVAQGLKAAQACPVLTRLLTQRRMVPGIADVARHLAYGSDGIRDDESVLDKPPLQWVDFLPQEPLVIVDTADLHSWSGKQPGSLSRFNFYSATLAVELAAMAAANVPQPPRGERAPVGIVTPFAAQRRLLSRLVEEMGLGAWVLAGTVHTFQGSEADVIIFDSVLDEPYYSARLCDPAVVQFVKRDLNVAVTRARDKFVFVGSSEWLNRNAKPASGLGQLWAFLKDRADLVSAVELVEVGFPQRVADPFLHPEGWRIPHQGDEATHEILDETSFFERFQQDVTSASRSVFGLVPYFGEYRWPRIQPLFGAALARGIEVTLVTPPLSEADNRAYVEKAIANLRELGAVIISAAGLHGKDIVIDEHIHYTGSLNWASHRGRAEIMHRTESPALGRLVLQYLQARHIRRAAVHEDGTARVCPVCGGPTLVVNQRRQHGMWDFQAVKVGCANPDCRGYLRNIDERPPFRDVPRCEVDGRTKFRRVRRGRGEIWQCPKHPRECSAQKVVPGDPA